MEEENMQQIISINKETPLYNAINEAIKIPEGSEIFTDVVIGSSDSEKCNIYLKDASGNLSTIGSYNFSLTNPNDYSITDFQTARIYNTATKTFENASLSDIGNGNGKIYNSNGKGVYQLVEECEKGLTISEIKNRGYVVSDNLDADGKYDLVKSENGNYLIVNPETGKRYSTTKFMASTIDATVPSNLVISKNELNNLTVKTEDMRQIKNSLVDVVDFFENDLSMAVNEFIGEGYPALYPSVKEKLAANSYYSEADLTNRLKSFQNAIIGQINSVIYDLKQIINKNEEIDYSEDLASGPKKINRITPSQSTPVVPADTPSANPDEIVNVTPTPVIVDELTLAKFSPAIVGLVTFAEIVSLYEKIGDATPVQSSPTGNYGLIGIAKQDSKYYYQLLDKDTGKIYYVEISDKTKVNWDEKGERKAVEITGDNAMILNTPAEGEGVVARLPEKNEVFLVEQGSDTTEYYSITDPTNGDKGYIPVSDSVSTPIDVSKLGQNNVDGEVAK